METNHQSANMRILVIVLASILGATLLAWRPWTDASKQTITVTGEATVKAVPDEFTFTPQYQKTATSAQEAIASVSAVGNASVAKMKSLGAKDSEITTNVTTSKSYEPVPLSSEGGPGGIPTPIGSVSKDIVATYTITATLHDKAVAQKALDYLATTPVLYAVTPQSTFSADTKKKLQAQARTEGVQDAHSKAVDIAKGLGSHLGSVVSVTEPTGGIGIMPLSKASISSSTDANTTPVLETGMQDVTYSVTVVYRIW